MWIVEKIRVSDKVKLIILLVLAILTFPSLPFQLYRVAYYLLFFFVGYKVWQYGDSYRKNIKLKKVFISCGVFAVIFIGLRLLTAHLLEMSETAPLFAKIVLKMSSTFCKMAYSSIGVIAMYSTAVCIQRNILCLCHILILALYVLAFMYIKNLLLSIFIILRIYPLK